MPNWDDGYVTDVVYTSNFYREATPNWLATAALLLGHRPPDLSKPFRYADLGCAHGFTAIAVAATCPQAEVWGFDFNPAHIESARGLAEQAGLTNIHFVEASFGELAAAQAEALPEFDFIVSHGVLSWISPANRTALTSLVGRRLRPGGLAYLSYNVTTGWASMLPLRGLMRMLAEASPTRSDHSVPTMIEFLDRMKAAGALYFGSHPALENRLQDLRKQDVRYIAHEFLNKDWHPLMFAEVADEMAEAKCNFIGSATLSENIDAISVPSGMAPLLAEASHLRLRETLRDFGSAQGFRRDIYRKGTGAIPIGEHQAMLSELTLAWTGLSAGDQVTITTPIGSLTGRPELYRPLLAILEQENLTVGRAQALEAFAGRPLLELLQAITLLMAGGFAHPLIPGGLSQATKESSARLNAAIARLNANGGEMPRLCVPATGAAMNVDLLETLAVGEMLAGRPTDLEALSGAVSDALARSGRAVQRDGQAVRDRGEALRIVTDALQNILERRVPILRRLGVLD